MRRTTGALALAAAALLLGMAACGGGGGNKSSSEAESEGGTTTIAGQASNDHGSKDVSSSSSVDLEMDNYYFEPTLLKGKPGEKITIKLENKGSVEHNFSVSGQGIDQDLEPGKDATVTVTFPKSGTLQFFCKYHRSQGMAGGLQASAGSSGSGGSTSTGGTSTSQGY
jgi:plastocyanin